MRLRRLELYGFKTFADPTELRFDDGITAVIGPNGSGKSNLADALLWVLAERRLSLLRASEAGDIIFAGSRDRRPLGYAEVALTIDNSLGRLPLELSEIRITRRLYRNGESEYRINGRRCRRRDVVDLFLDTGVGREAFTIISQREVDAILSLEATDRRRLLEEVAGVERYRSRRDEAVRRLDETRANLQRLEDLTAGLQMQVEPLAVQREQAQQFLALRADAQRLRLSLQVKEYQLAERRALRGAEELADLDADIDAARTELHRAEAAEQAARLEQLAADDQLAEAQAALAELAGANERHETRRQVAAERLHALTERLADAERDLTTQSDTAARARIELTGMADEQTQLAERLAALDAGIAAARDEATVRREVESAAAAALAERRGSQSAAAEELAGRRAVLRSAQAALERSVGRLDELRRRGAGAAEQRTAAEADLRRAAESRAAAEAAHAAAGNAHAELSARLAEAEAERAGRQRRAGELSRALEGRQARLEVLLAAEAQHEGLSTAARKLLDAAAAGLLPPFVPLAELLEVEPGWENAIEAFLGPKLHGLVADSPADALAAVDWLAAEQVGRAVVIPRGADGAEGGPRVVGSSVPGLAARLFGAAVFVEQLDAALAGAADGSGRTWVTRTGEVVEPSGAVTAGAARQASGLLQRRRERQELEAAVAAEAAELAVAQAAEDEAAGVEAALQAELRSRAADLEAARVALARAEQARAGAESALRAAEGAVAQATEQLADLEHERQAAAAVIETETAAVAILEARHHEAGAAVAADESALDSLRRVRAAADEAVSALLVERARLESRRQSAAEAAARQQRTVEAAEAAAERLRRERSGWAVEQTRLEAEVEELSREQAEQGETLLERRRAVEALQAARRDAGEQVKESMSSARAARDALSEAQQAHHRAELRRLQADAELAHLRQRIAEEHTGLSPERAAEQVEPVTNRAEASEQLERLRAEISALGEVNLGAIDEYERVTQRLAFYAAQRCDLDSAGADLQAVIDEIDAVTSVRLRETFDRVQAAFGELFVRVFGPGGQAGLRWTDPADPLGSGIEVEVVLPGKRRQSIVLLSGGERAMTTVTLLLAMFRVKPSPFCLLDELDAPLDDSNIRKYGELLRDFAAESQFIIITHNPQTTRAADVLYGVTMQEPGVSKVLSHRPPDETGAADAAG